MYAILVAIKKHPVYAIPLVEITSTSPEPKPDADIKKRRLQNALVDEE
jgi:hypothetical protein